MTIEILTSGATAVNVTLETLCDRLEKSRRQGTACFDEVRMACVAAISDAIRRATAGPLPPALIHFAYWTRRAALAQLRDTFRATQTAGCAAKPSGLVFHLPPQNVETVFLYSWVLSYLTGNANVTRLPTHVSAEMSRVLNIVLDHLDAVGEDTQFFIHYPGDVSINASLSTLSDARLVWGGDTKVEAFSALPLRQGGKSLWFGDRRSFCVLASNALSDMDQAARKILASALYNDVFVFDQLACSSPQTIFVIGDPARARAPLVATLSLVAEIAAERGAVVSPAHEIRKLTEAMALAAMGSCDKIERLHDRLTLAQGTGSRASAQLGGGFLEIRNLDTLEDLASEIRERDQTMTYFGFERATMAAFAEALRVKGISRIVPVGQALDFDSVWDGYDILRELVHLIKII